MPRRRSVRAGTAADPWELGHLRVALRRAGVTQTTLRALLALPADALAAWAQTLPNIGPRRAQLLVSLQRAGDPAPLAGALPACPPPGAPALTLGVAPGLTHPLRQLLRRARLAIPPPAGHALAAGGGVHLLLPASLRDDPALPAVLRELGGLGQARGPAAWLMLTGESPLDLRQTSDAQLQQLLARAGGEPERRDRCSSATSPGRTCRPGMRSTGSAVHRS